MHVHSDEDGAAVLLCYRDDVTSFFILLITIYRTDYRPRIQRRDSNKWDLPSWISTTLSYDDNQYTVNPHNLHKDQ